MEFDSPVKTPKTFKKPIFMRMILLKKLNQIGEIECYKERIVAHRHRQRPEINFDKSSAPLISIAAVRLILAVLRRPMTVNLLDVMTAFLKSTVNEELCVT